MRLTNKQNVPPAIVRAAQPYEKVEGRIGVTTLISPPLQRWLAFRYGDEIELDVMDVLWALKGSATHAILEQYAPHGSWAEAWLETRIEPFTLVGVLDLYTPLTGLIEDYKEQSVWRFVNGETWDIENQLNVNAWLAREHRLPVTAIRGVYILRDWTKSKVGGKYPAYPVHVTNFPLWPPDMAEQYVMDRIAEHARWLDFSGPTPPVCSPRDRRAASDTWAVFKKGGKRAMRVLDSREEAEKWMETSGGDTIEYRHGDQWVKCAKFCSVAGFCPYYQDYLKGKANGQDMEQ